MTTAEQVLKNSLDNWGQRITIKDTIFISKADLEGKGIDELLQPYLNMFFFWVKKETEDIFRFTFAKDKKYFSGNVNPLYL